jgi:hypothetical protein
MLYRPFTIVAGAAAVTGGALRIVAIFTTGTFAPQTLAWFYFLIDVLLTLGLVGWYVPRADRLGGVGLTGFVTAAGAILLIRSAGLLGANTYQAGATLLAVGLAVMSAAALWRRDKPVLAPMLWLLCLASGIAALAFRPVAMAAFVLFGLGYVAAGVELLRKRA